MTVDIPHDWKRVRIGDIAAVKTGGTPSRREGAFWAGEIPWMASGEIHQRRVTQTAEFITKLGFDNSSARWLPVGTVMLALNGQGKTRGMSAILETPVTCNQSLAGIIADENVLAPEYLLQTLEREYDAIRGLTGDDGRNGLNLGLIRKIAILLPPISEQQLIVAMLSAIDTAIERTRAVIDQVRVVKQALLADLMTNGLPGRHKKFKTVVNLGRVPANWRVQPVGRVCDAIVPGRNKPQRFDGDIPWITMPDIDSPYLAASKVGLCVSDEAIKEAGGRTVPANSVIMSCIGEFGIIAVTQCVTVINQQLHAFVCPPEIDSYFLSQALRTQVRYMDQIATKTTIAYLNKDNCNCIPIPIPSLDEQKQISAVLGAIDARAEIEEREQQQLETCKTALSDALLTGRVRVPHAEGVATR